MQYIQLQGQVAAELDLPIEGGFNLFIDTSDNSIKAKDFEGNLTGGGLSLIEVTRGEVGQLVLSSSLTPGTFYKITGVASASFYEANSISYTGYGNEIQDGGTTIILQAATDKTLSKKGIGLFYVPNYENPNVPTAPPDTNYLVWDSTSRLEFSSSFGVFDHEEYVNLYANGSSSYSNLRANIGNNSITLEAPGNEEVPSPDFFTNPANYPMSIVGDNTDAWAGISGPYEVASYNVGDCVIWGGRVWQNRSGSLGYTTGGWPFEQLTLNNDDWTKVPFNEISYTIVADIIEYEFEWDNISYRKGANNVEVRCDAKLMLDYWGYNTMKYFPWGHYGTQNISISNSYLDAFVNYPHDAYASEIKFADYGGFNAHYWGRETEIYNISSDFAGHMVSLNLGYHTIINKITLGKNARISDIYTYDNENGGYTALYKITLSTGTSIDDYENNIYMYNGSYMKRLILEDNANITDINLYKESHIEDSKLGINSYIASIALNDYADFRQVELGNSSYIEYINADVSACFKRVKLGIDSYINYIGIGVNGYFKHVEMGDESSIFCNLIGNNSFFRYVNLGIHSKIYSIDQSAGNSYFEYINTGIDSDIYNIDLGSYSYFENINTGVGSSIYNISQEETFLADTTASYTIPSTSSYFQNTNIGINSNISSIWMGSNTSLNNFEVANEGGLGLLILSESVDLTLFKIGQDYGFGEMVFSSSLSNITIERGFSNLMNTATQSLDASVGGNGSPLINFYNRNIITIDITGATTPYSYDLPDGDYEGQELTFVAKSDGSHSIFPYDINIWTNKLVVSGLDWGLENHSGSYYGIRPFAKYDGTNWNWKNATKVIWTGGVWVTDAEAFND